MLNWKLHLQSWQDHHSTHQKGNENSKGPAGCALVLCGCCWKSTGKDTKTMCSQSGQNSWWKQLMQQSLSVSFLHQQDGKAISSLNLYGFVKVTKVKLWVFSPCASGCLRWSEFLKVSLDWAWAQATASRVSECNRAAGSFVRNPNSWAHPHTTQSSFGGEASKSASLRFSRGFSCSPSADDLETEEIIEITTLAEHEEGLLFQNLFSEALEVANFHSPD